ncbi:piercer of microtubule wall 1 protein isoform X2 [Phascolarctos cinereus]|uniref:UPF0691 protein C9orf116 homolog isoform X2 n=1 Tax=Phascolarctos cinereus TaxID=38626 RepID=A0A6P5JTL1_PHACI|nr:UPF0691 protein C9orf116 homolog isoform X2 [Phascolarctos cinereus]
MPQEAPQQSSDYDEQKAEGYLEKTSDYYRVSHNLPARFNNPGWFQGYRIKETHPVYRTSNQTYGSRAPTVHEMPKYGGTVLNREFTNKPELESYVICYCTTRLVSLFSKFPLCMKIGNKNVLYKKK